MIACQPYEETKFIEPSPLIGNFKSYISVENFLKESPHISSKKHSIQKGSMFYSGFTLTKITIEKFYHLECSGKLVLYFLNDRLMSTTFYPENFELYLNKIQNFVVKISANRSAIIKNTKITYGKHYSDNHHYVDWEDIRLSNEFNYLIN